MAMMTGLLGKALESNDEEDAKKKKKGKSKGIMDAFGGGSGLASTGLSVGAGLVDRNAQKKAVERAEGDPNNPAYRPKRRRATAVMGAIDEQQRKKEAGLATLSQAMMDWARAR